MKPDLNKSYVITTDAFFFAPDGEQYKAVFGTVTAILNDEQTLGIKTNRGSSNWYVVIGDMIVAGCQIHYCIRSDGFSKKPTKMQIVHDGQLSYHDENITRIYDASESGRS